MKTKMEHSADQGRVMHLMWDGDAAPSATDIVVDSGHSGACWKYTVSGLPNVWVVGGLHFHSDQYSFQIKNIQEIHHLISERIISKPTLSGAEFRFLRKEIGTTLPEFASSCKLGTEELSKWEAGEGFAVVGAENEIRLRYAHWRENCDRPQKPKARKSA